MKNIPRKQEKDKPRRKNMKMKMVSEMFKILGFWTMTKTYTFQPKKLLNSVQNVLFASKTLQTWLVFVPCNHLCVCQKCFLELIQRDLDMLRQFGLPYYAANSQLLCPLCRRHIDLRKIQMKIIYD